MALPPPAQHDPPKVWPRRTWPIAVAAVASGLMDLLIIDMIEEASQGSGDGYAYIWMGLFTLNLGVVVGAGIVVKTCIVRRHHQRTTRAG
jgi:hypothetical protein